MAEALIRQRALAEGRGATFTVSSAGTWAPAGEPAVADAQAVMAARGLDLSPHRSREITAADAVAADLILVMTADHRSALAVDFPAVAGRLVLMSELAGGRWDVTDPIGQPRPAFEATAAELGRLIDAGWERIVGQAP